MRPSLLLIPAFIVCGCAQGKPEVTLPAAVPPASGGCLSAGDGALQADLRGALDADLVWHNNQMQCEGGPRPDGRGLRVAIAGPLATPGESARQLRFIFGIDLHDAAAGAAKVLPTNLTVIVEGEQKLYATLGDDKCAVEDLQRTPLTTGDGKLERVQVRGYCTEPATDLAGVTRLMVPTFSFTAVVHKGEEP